jgi:moderate conductance mechanosensitive channel
MGRSHAKLALLVIYPSYSATSFLIVKPLHLRKHKLKYAGISLITCALLLFNPMAIGQTQDLQGSLGWKSYGLAGDVVFAPVQLDGHHLFSIATERQRGEQDQWGLGALQFRRNRIEHRLKSQVRYLVENQVDPESIQVVTTQLNQQAIVQVVTDSDATSPIVTVTTLDAEIYGLSESEVAEEYARQIQQGLKLAIQERQPDAQRKQLQRAGLGGAIAALGMALLFGWQQQIGRSRRQLRQEFHIQREGLIHQQSIIGTDGNTTQTDSKEQQQLFNLKYRIERKTWQKRLLQLMLVVVGGAGLAWVLQCFPQTRSLGLLLFKQPIGLLLIGLSITLATILSHFLIGRILTHWIGTEDQLPIAQIERRRRRSLVLSPVLNHVTTVVLVIVGFLIAYSLVSFSTGLTLFTGIGILGVVISLAFQSAIKDALSGWMLLARDAFTVGDIVMIKEGSGVVEQMNLLMTQIRSSSGDLITLRNGEITNVTNRSKDWSRMDFTVLVDYDTDIKQALEVLREVFQTMQSDPVWHLSLIGEPDVLGVEQFEQNGILLKIRVQTPAGQQFNVTREFRFRLNQTFQATGIKIPIPQQEVRYREPELQGDVSKNAR